MSDALETLKHACGALADGDLVRSRSLIRDGYPFRPPGNAGRRCTALESTRVFIRDGFIDRYSGARLVFPGVLRLLSRLMPDEVPFHPNWKMDKTHPAFWELFPTLDHIIPVARGGADDEANRVSTSMLRNSAKANWTLEELGWRLLPPGKVSDWDGLMGWFTRYLEWQPEHQRDAYLRRWFRAATQAAEGSAVS